MNLWFSARLNRSNELLFFQHNSKQYFKWHFFFCSFWICLFLLVDCRKQPNNVIKGKITRTCDIKMPVGVLL